MGKQYILDDDVVKELVRRAIELDMFFSPMNEVLRVILNITKGEPDVNTGDYPHSEVLGVQRLLDGLKDTIFNISENGMTYHSKSRKWVAHPNVVTITVQDARAKNLRITVYGRPHEFDVIKQSLEIEEDMGGYSRFVIKNDRQLPATINVIKQAYELKKQRGRL